MCGAIKKILLDIVAFTHILTLQIPPLNLSPFILSLNGTYRILLFILLFIK